jgi:aspartate/methionine/tyrosine aminotransferase
MTTSISPTLAMNQLAQLMEGKGRKVFKYGFGQSPFPVPGIFEEELKKYAAEKDYLPSAGLPALRVAISDYYKRKHSFDISPDHVIIAPGSKMLLFLIRMCVDGYSLLPAPSWVSYAPQAAALHQKVKWLHTSLESGWLPDPEEIDVFCNKHPKERHLLIINYPSNPTGTIPNTFYLKELTTVCRKHNVLVISDEIYKDLCFHSDYQSLSAYYPEGTIICDGISKWAGAGGHRLGYALFPTQENEIRDQIISLASETYSCVTNPVQRAAISLFEGSAELKAYNENSIKILKAVASFTYEAMKEMDIQVAPSYGGFYFYPSFVEFKEEFKKEGISGSDALCARMLEECGVALLSGTCFGRNDNCFEARWSYVDFDGKNALDHANDLSEISPENWLKKYAPKIVEGPKVLADWLAKVGITTSVLS